MLFICTCQYIYIKHLRIYIFSIICFTIASSLQFAAIILYGESSYLKRGVNDRGRVANDVETEQIILDEEAGSCKGKMSSVVQMRGSIPLFWSQEASRFSPKPDIICKKLFQNYVLLLLSSCIPCIDLICAGKLWHFF